MKRRNALLAGASVAVAGGAILTGAILSNSALASDSSSPTAKVTVVTMTPGTDGAVRCEFDASQLPVPQPGPAPAGTDGSLHVSTGAAVDGDGPQTVFGGAPAGALVVSGTFAGGLGAPPELPTPPGGGVGTGVVRVGTNGSLSDVAVRDGTPAECAAALETIKALPAPGSPGTSGSVTGSAEAGTTGSPEPSSTTGA